MANANIPHGFRPVASLGSSGYTGKVEMFYVPSTDAAAIGIGDPCELAGGLHTDGTPIAKKLSGIGATTIGVCVGVKLLPTDLTLTGGYRKASTAMYILVDTDPNTIYEIQEDGVGGAVALASGTQNASMILGSVSTTTGVSGCMLDSSTAAANAALGLLILRPSPAIDNTVPLAYAKWLVKLNLHQYGAGVVRVGV